MRRGLTVNPTSTASAPTPRSSLFSSPPPSGRPSTQPRASCAPPEVVLVERLTSTCPAHTWQTQSCCLRSCRIKRRYAYVEGRNERVKVSASGVAYAICLPFIPIPKRRNLPRWPRLFLLERTRNYPVTLLQLPLGPRSPHMQRRNRRGQRHLPPSVRP